MYQQPLDKQVDDLRERMRLLQQDRRANIDLHQSQEKATRSSLLPDSTRVTTMLLLLANMNNRVDVGIA